MKNLINTYLLLAMMLLLLMSSCSSKRDFIPFGHSDIDRIRMAVKSFPTNPENFLERKNTLALWTRFMMFSGASMLSLDPEEHNGHFNLYNFRYPVYNAIAEINYSPEFATEIDYQFGVLEDIFADFAKDKDQYLVELKRDPADNNGEVYDWPSLRGDAGQTAFTKSPGPMQGKVHWKFPVSSSWYSRPAFDNGKVYMGSPGKAYEAYCIDTKTGNYIWKTVPEGLTISGGYYGPRASSSVLISGDNIILRKIQVSGGKNHIVYINKETGKNEKGIVNNEFLNSSSGYAPLDGNDKYLIYPQGIQPDVQQVQKLKVDANIYKQKREDYPFDSLVCKSTVTGELLWQQYMGEYYAEPLLDGVLVYCGNIAGDFRCYNVTSGKLVWEAKTGAPINARAAVSDRAVFIGNEAGKVFSFNKVNGKYLWSYQLPVIQNAFQLFSRFTIEGSNAYVGSADKNLYCFNAKSGSLNWKFTLDDWIRSAPLVLGQNVFAATTSGRMYCIRVEDKTPVITWEKKISDFPIYADISVYQGDIYAATSDFDLVNVEAETGIINWQTSTFECIYDEKGNKIQGDIVGQPDYQSSAVIVDGIAYFGTQRFVFAVEVESGKEVWRFEERGQVCGAPLVDNGKVFFGQRGGTPNFYCVDAKTGNLIWKKRFGHVWASANCINDKLYLNTEGGNFMCINENTGDIFWKYDETLGHSYTVPAFFENLVYFGAGHEYYAFDRETGLLKWQFNIGHGNTDSGTCTVKDGIWYFGGQKGDYFYAIDALTAKVLWKYDLKDVNVSPSTNGKFVLTGNFSFRLLDLYGRTLTVCLDSKTGEFKYQFPFGGLSGSAIGNNLAFSASTSDPYFRAWDLESGKIRWQYRMGGRAEESCTTIYGDKAFIIATDGYLYCFK